MKQEIPDIRINRIHTIRDDFKGWHRRDKISEKDVMEFYDGTLKEWLPIPIVKTVEDKRYEGWRTYD